MYKMTRKTHYLVQFLINILISLTPITARDATVLMTEVFAIPLDPPMFNWTYEGNLDQFIYTASLKHFPDLPDWIGYLFSERHRQGFLYGVTLKRPDAAVPLEVVALNKKTYETRIENINVDVTEKLNRARFEVHLQINDLNVDDLFDVEKMDALKDIFRKQLWKDSEDDLYVTFLGSAVELGARKPLKPSEGEGVVIRLGSGSVFSDDLIKLQEEVVPIQKSPSCHYKKTTKERFFKDSGFNLDWCYFRLIDNNNVAVQHSETNQHFSLKDEESYDSSGDDIWRSVLKSQVPQRTYINEVLVSMLVPTLILIVLGLLLSFLLCFHHDDIEDEDSETYFENLFHICEDFYYNFYIYKAKKRNTYVEDQTPEDISQFETIRRATESLRNFSSQRDMRMSPDLHSHTNSPNSTLGHGVHCRPSPPPYVRPKFKPGF